MVLWGYYLLGIFLGKSCEFFGVMENGIKKSCFPGLKKPQNK